jgi:hypothetical protein
MPGEIGETHTKTPGLNAILAEQKEGTVSTTQ